MSLPTNPTKGRLPNRQSSATADPAESAESSGHPRSAQATQAHPGVPPRANLRLPVHPTEGPKVKLHFAVPPLQKMFAGLLQPPRPVGHAPSVRTQLRNIVKFSWLNVLFVFWPLSWAAQFANFSPTIIFIFSFLATIPLAVLLGFAAEQLIIRVGPAIGGLLGATFGNAVELIVAALALRQGQLRVVQASLLGSILSNLLLVLGMCFFVGGLKSHTQTFNPHAAQLQISLLSIAVFSIVIPAAFHASVAGRTGSSSEQAVREEGVLGISRGTSIILLVVYVAYLLFQLWTHADMFTAEEEKKYSTRKSGERHKMVDDIERGSQYSQEEGEDDEDEKDERDEEPQLSTWGALLLLIGITVITGVTVEFLVGSIGGFTETGNVNKEFTGLILLPIVGNAAEIAITVMDSYKNRLDLAISNAVNSSIQIALFVIPFLVLLGWIIGQPLSLFFDTFETIEIFTAVIIVNYAIADAKTHWLEGLILVVIYVLIGLSVWFYPGISSTG